MRLVRRLVNEVGEEAGEAPVTVMEFLELVWGSCDEPDRKFNHVTLMFWHCSKTSH